MMVQYGEKNTTAQVLSLRILVRFALWKTAVVCKVEWDCGKSMQVRAGHSPSYPLAAALLTLSYLLAGKSCGTSGRSGLRSGRGR